MIDELCRIDELTHAGVVRKQQSITRLFPTFFNRVRSVVDKGSVRLRRLTPEVWHFKIHSGTKNGVWYDAYIRFKDFPGIVRRYTQDMRLWTTSREHVDLTKLARAILLHGDFEWLCSCPAFQYWGPSYILTQRDAKYPDDEPENRPPNIRNPRQYGAVCKHLQVLLTTFPFYASTIARWLKDQYGRDIEGWEDEAKRTLSGVKKVAGELKRRKEEPPGPEAPEGRAPAQPIRPGPTAPAPAAGVPPEEEEPERPTLATTSPEKPEEEEPEKKIVPLGAEPTEPVVPKEEELRQKAEAEKTNDEEQEAEELRLKAEADKKKEEEEKRKKLVRPTKPLRPGEKPEVAKESITEKGIKDRLGKCYQLSGRYVMDHEDAILVHGTINGKVRGMRDFDNPHAWVEEGNEIYDLVQDLRLPKDAYLQFMGAKELKRFTHDEMCRMCVKSKTWGPWESKLREDNSQARYFSYVGSYDGAVKVNGKWVRANELSRIRKDDWVRWQGPPTGELARVLKQDKPRLSTELFPDRVRFPKPEKGKNASI